MSICPPGKRPYNPDEKINNPIELYKPNMSQSLK
jgi:hypothetical protein